jgi:hypothetical protein
MGLFQYITSSFSTLDSRLVLHNTLFRTKLEYASVIWNSITSTDSSKLERIERKFTALCYSTFFNGVSNCNYEDILLRLNLLTLQLRRRHLDYLFLINVL